MNEELLREYSEICRAEKHVKERKATLATKIMKHLEKMNMDKVQSPWGTYTVAERMTYTYSDEVAMAKEEVKAIQIEEEKNGKAEPRITQFVRFQASKV